MTNRTRAALLVALGVAVGATFAGVAGAARPLWSYQSGTTLLAKSAQYRDGFTIGAIDGYFRAHERLDRRGEGPLWLETCLSAGWTMPHVTRVAAEYLDKAVMEMKNPAAHIILDGLKKACAQEK